MARNEFITARQLGKYVIQRRLGSGANSVIYEAIDPGDGAAYAIKRVVKRTFSDDRFFRQADNEFQTGRQIDHPAVRKMFDLLRVRSFFRVKEMHLVMEMFYGRTLESARPTDQLAIARIFAQAARGLEAMHSHGFVHADIKPNNILVSAGEQIKIIDLGQSCPIGTIKDRIQGTPDYIAPEQVHCRPIDRRTDVFNLGATLYWVLTGKPVTTVLPKAQPGREIALVTSPRTTPPEDINSQVVPAMSRLVMDCVNIAPADRPPDMRSVYARLEMIELILRKERPVTPPRNAGTPPPPDGDDWGDADPAGPGDDTVDLDGP